MASPDEEALRRDLAACAFTLGERRGKWRLTGVAFPYALFFVAAPVRPRGPAGFLLRAECRGYSGIAPTSQLWHGANNASLALTHRPRNGSDALRAFSDWNSCLYHPIDRTAASHWSADQFREKRWTPEKTITFLLETVHDLLHCSEYTHADLPSAALELPPEFVDGHLVSELRERGRGVRESGGFLLGRREGDTRTIEAFLAYDVVDPDALRGHIEFDGSRMDRVWSECRRRGLQVIADVHTHPGSVGQSDVDRANPMIPERGHLALIVPDFARKLYLPGQVGIYEFRGREGWLDHSRQGSRYFAVRRFA